MTRAAKLLEPERAIRFEQSQIFLALVAYSSNTHDQRDKFIDAVGDLFVRMIAAASKIGSGTD
jgi:hypothetical protein